MSMMFANILLFLCLPYLDNAFQVDGYDNFLEGVKFMKSNGLKFVSLVNFGNTLNATGAQKALTTILSNGLYGKWISHEDASISDSLDSFLILASADHILSPRIHKLMTFLRKTGRERSLVLVQVSDSGLEGRVVMALENASVEANENMMFYANLGQSWHLIFYVKNTERAISQPLKLTEDFRSLEGSWNLQGLAIMDNTLTFPPHNILTDCDTRSNNCQASGIVVSIAQVISRYVNASLQFRKDQENSWGTNPKSGLF